MLTSRLSFPSLNFALSQYDRFKEIYQAGGALGEQIAEAVEAGTLEYNESAVLDFEDAAYVEGLWVNNPGKGWGTHADLLYESDGKDNLLVSTSGETMTGIGMKIVLVCGEIQQCADKIRRHALIQLPEHGRRPRNMRRSQTGSSGGAQSAERACRYNPLTRRHQRVPAEKFHSGGG